MIYSSLPKRKMVDQERTFIEVAISSGALSYVELQGTDVEMHSSLGLREH